MLKECYPEMRPLGECPSCGRELCGLDGRPCGVCDAVVLGPEVVARLEAMLADEDAGSAGKDFLRRRGIGGRKRIH